ncbi:MAG: transcriptional regulator [Paraburkholderia sp.]|uniref:PhaM family polyhydroxyalkanoate granule multifunctional regulatory protein n=1 Tax=Paraburkholderia sp. TaxID=1926495 RepID=UPI00121D8143|nr:PhaM family polyhydroxyalkanoate granule multifunctional regulatory protein [Paraburkholderia sp.]TAL97158.1 MAG: transcriptional regulator [Paraburkholderia sp.]
MTDTTGSTPPFPGFPGFPPAEMLDRMWDMMRLTPFGSAFPGAQAGAAQGLGPSLSMMSDMMAPLTNVEELDKRITDMRAVEQWLKLNLNMLQSAIQALEVQRATLATLRAFGAFAQSSMKAAAPTPGSASTSSPSSSMPSWMPPPEASAAGQAGAAGTKTSASDAADEADGAGQAPPFEASAWWNLLQSQFNQLAQFAMAQPAAAPGATATAEDLAEAAHGADEPGVASGTGTTREAAPKSSGAAKRPATKRAPSSKSTAEGRGAKKTPASGA